MATTSTNNEKNPRDINLPDDRELLIRSVIEQQAFNLSWNQVKAHVIQLYDIVPRNTVISHFNSQSKWFTDGFVDMSKNEQSCNSTANDLPFTYVASV